MLTEIEPEEVSFVDRAANRKKFIVVKRDGGTTMKLKKEEKEKLLAALDDTKDRVDHLKKEVGGAEEVEDGQVEKASLDTLLRALAENVSGLGKADVGKAKVTCAECGWSGEMPDDKKCPKCGAKLMAKGTPEPQEKGGEPQGQPEGKEPAPDSGKKQEDPPAPAAGPSKDDLQKALEEFAEATKRLVNGVPPAAGAPNAGAGAQPDPGAAVPASEFFSKITGLTAMMKELSEKLDAANKVQKGAAPIESRLQEPAGSARGGETKWPFDMAAEIEREKKAAKK